MAHAFDVNKWAKLDSPERRKALPAETALRQFGLQSGEVVADVGCGIGYFSLPASTIVGAAGRVIALDIAEELLFHVRERAAASGANNIETIKTTEQGLLLPDAAADIVLAFFILHEVPDPLLFLAEVNRILKIGGRVAVIDWEKREMMDGPPVGHRVAVEEAMLLLQRAGFSVSPVQIGADYYGLQGVKLAGEN